MKQMTVFLPTRKGSERVSNKNTRPFASFKNGLLELKLRQLLDVKLIDEIILSTNDEYSIEIGIGFSKIDDRVKVIVRPDTLASSATDLVDLVRYVPGICSNQHILWTHVTSPFVTADNYDAAIQVYFLQLEAGFDSLMSVKRFQNFLWSKDKKDIINRKDNKKWPRTQDLEELYEVDSAVFIAGKDVYTNESDRIGKNPFLFVQEGLQSFDVDWQEDFELAEVIYSNLYEK
jgi:N-acylneuraminate cytidylyltransferase